MHAESSVLRPNDHHDIDQLRAALASDGLDLVASVALADLDAELAAQIRGAAAAELPPGEMARSVVVVGNAGGGVFYRLSVAERAAQDPLDTFSAARVRAALSVLREGARSVLVYPGECTFSLQRLGAACGFGVPSWLGINIHPDLGTWFAFRAVAVTTARLPAVSAGGGPDVCADCRGHDCVSACPAGAPGPPGHFDLNACLDYRLRAGSSCASTCLARLACPVGARHRYPAALTDHVYRRSLASIRRCRSGVGR